MRPINQPKPERKRWTPVTQPPRPPEPAGWSALLFILLVPMGFGLLAIASEFLPFSLNPLVWYVIRASGMMLYLLIWATVVLGLGVTTRYFDGWLSKGTTYSLHSYVPQLAYAFLAAHLLGLTIDEYLPFTFVELLAPFRSPITEPWTGFGVIAMYLFLIIVVTVALRRYIPYRIWRFLHMLAFPLYFLALMHGIGSGTDTGTFWAQAIYMSTGLTVLLLTIVRLLQRGKRIAGIPTDPTPEPLDRMGTNPSLDPVIVRRGR